MGRLRNQLLVGALGLVLLLVGMGIALVPEARIGVEIRQNVGGHWVTIAKAEGPAGRPLHLAGHAITLAGAYNWQWGGCPGTPSGRGRCGGGPFEADSWIRWCSWGLCYGGVRYIQQADTMWGYGLVLPQAVAQYYADCDHCSPSTQHNWNVTHYPQNYVHVSNDCRSNGVCINDQVYVDNWKFNVGRFFQADSHPVMWAALDIYQDGAYYFDGGCEQSC